MYVLFSVFNSRIFRLNRKGVKVSLFLKCSAYQLSCVRPQGLQPTSLLCPWGFSRPEYWSSLPCPSPGNLPDPGIEPRSPALQADSLPSGPAGKPFLRIAFPRVYPYFFFLVYNSLKVQNPGIPFSSCQDSVLSLLRAQVSILV